MKKAVKKAVAVLMAVLVGALVSVQVFAASSAKKYISEVILCYAASSAEAETKLKAKGYKLADKTDLNATLEQGTYIGYKLTDNKEEAITDLAVMNMAGDYSYTDYETMLAKNRENVDAWISDLIATIEEYRSNYEAGAENTLQIHDYLNKITEDVSGEGMGDFLLDCDIDSDNHHALTDVFMKGNSAVIASIEQALTLACDSSDTTWLTRVNGASYDETEEKYIALYKTVNKAENAMDAAFGDTAAALLGVWDDFYGVLQDIETKLSVENEEITYDVVDEETLAEDETGFSNAVTDLEAVNDIALYDKLADVEYEGDTLLAFFNRPAAEVEPYELYPLCEALTQGQRAQISMSGIKQLVLSAIAEKGKEDDTYRTDLDAYIGGLEEISVYDGVDLEIYEKGVALTSDATQHESSSTDHWYNAFLNPENNTERWTAYIMFYIVPTVVMTAVFGAVMYAANAAHAGALHALNASKGVIAKGADSAVRLIFNDPWESLPAGEKLQMFFRGFFEQRTGESLALSIAKSTCFILVLILLVVDVVMLIRTIQADMEDLDYEDIPHHILDATAARNGIDYVMYKAATTTDGQSADLNGYKSGEGWLVLYYTKDSQAGDPITDTLTVKTGSNSTPANCKNVHLFGSKDAVDITSKLYTGKGDSGNGTFLFAGNNALPVAGSAVTDSIAFAIIIAGLAVGIIAGLLTGKKAKKTPVQEV